MEKSLELLVSRNSNGERTPDADVFYPGQDAHMDEGQCSFRLRRRLVIATRKRENPFEVKLPVG